MSLVVNDVSVDIHHHRILRDVDLTLGDREVVAILGPSGSGKTTLLRVIAGLQKPTTGTVTLEGIDITDLPVHRRGIGLMFQDHALFPHRSVFGNVAFGLRMARAPRPEIAARVDEVLALVGLSGFADRRVDSLSGGERQRVALARALAPRPGLLLLDEPLGSLDRALRERLVDDLAQVLRSSGVSAIYVTHDQAEAFAMGDRLAVMRAGTIAQVARPEAVWTSPIDAGVARIVGPVSLIPIEVGADGSVPPPWRGVVDVASPPPPGAGHVAIRADTFRIETSAPNTPPDNTAPDNTEPDNTARLTAEVVDVSFRGDHHLVAVRLLGPEGSTKSAALTVAHRGREMPQPGDRVALHVVHQPVVVPPGP